MGLGSFLKVVVPTAVGAGAGFLIGGPAGAAVGAGIGMGAGASISSTDAAADVQEAAARDAASAQVYAADKAYDATMAGIKSQEEMTAPWRAAGEKALGTLQGMLGRGPGEFTESPGYLFRLGEGEKAIQRFASAKGGLLSGATGKALTRYGQDYATQDYQGFLNRWYDSLKPYQSLAGLGQTSATNTAAMMGQGYGNLAQINMATGAANAAGITGAAQAKASGYLSQGNIFQNVLNQGLGAYTLWKMGGFNGGSAGGGVAYGNLAQPTSGPPPLYQHNAPTTFP
jgi:hypothetical protein